MGGTIRFKLGGYFDTESDVDNGISVFKFIWDHMKELETLGIVTEIARFNGAGAGASDTNWPGETDGFQRDAWSTFRWNTSSNRSWEWYMHIYAADQYNGNAAPALVRGSTSHDGLGMSVAVSVNTGSGVTSNPWGGATGSLGSDAKGDPVWVTGSVGDNLFVFPRSNNLSGSHVSSKQNNWPVIGNEATQIRCHIITDDDGFVGFFAPSDIETDYGEWYTSIISPYTPNSIISSSVNTPLVVIQGTTDTVGIFNPDDTLGGTAGNTDVCGCGIIAADGLSTRNLRVDYPRFTTTLGLATDYFGSEIFNFISGSRQDQGQYWHPMDAFLFVDGDTESNYQGFCGMLNSPLIKVIRFVHSTFYTPEKDRISFDNVEDFIELNDSKSVVLVPWTGSMSIARNTGRREGYVSGSGLTPLETV